MDSASHKRTARRRVVSDAGTLRPATAFNFGVWRTHGELLAQARSSCWCDTQLHILDRLIIATADRYEEHSPGQFDRSWFVELCKFGHGHIHNTLIKENQSCPTTR